MTDVGSVKGAVARDVAPHIPAGVHFIPGHPIAGTEYSGPDAGFATLFENRWCILVPEKDADAGAIATLTRFCREHGIGVKERLPFGRYEFEPGEEMQHDTSPHVVRIGGRLTQLPEQRPQVHDPWPTASQ